MVQNISSSHLVIQEGGLDFPAQTSPAVTGIYKGGDGKLKITGTATPANSYIPMDDTLNSSIYKLEINKSLNNARLSSNINVRDALTLTNGNLEMLNRNIFFADLSTAALTNESETKRVFGTSGYLERTTTFSSSITAANPSNLGAVLPPFTGTNLK